jgi:hypothetical protein
LDTLGVAMGPPNMKSLGLTLGTPGANDESTRVPFDVASNADSSMGAGSSVQRGGVVIDEDSAEEDGQGGQAVKNRRLSGGRKGSRSASDIAKAEYVAIRDKTIKDMLPLLGTNELKTTTINGHLSALTAKKLALSAASDFDLCGAAGKNFKDTTSVKDLHQAGLLTYCLCTSLVDLNMFSVQVFMLSQLVFSGFVC